MTTDGGVRYALSADGVSIAYRRWRPGIPILGVGGFVTIQMFEGTPFDQLLERESRWGAVTYDRRGTGLSDRDRIGFTMDEVLADLDAVVDALGSRVLLLGLYQGGPAAITYAARNPAKVEALILTATFARGSDWLALPWVRALRAALREDFDTWCLAQASVVVRGQLPADAIADRLRESFGRDSALETYDALADHDATELLGKVRVPTLVVQQPNVERTLVESTRELAAAIPRAELVRDPSENFFFFSDETLATVDRLGDDDRIESPTRTAIQAVMFTDLVSSTEQTNQLGDHRYQGVRIRPAHATLVRRHRRCLWP